MCYDSVTVSVMSYVIVLRDLLLLVCIYALWYDFRRGHLFFLFVMFTIFYVILHCSV